MRLWSASENHRSNGRALAKLKARRKQWLIVHLWLGLGFGLFLAVIGLTGSVLVFWHEIDEALNPGLYEASVIKELQPKRIDELLATAKKAAPSGWDSVWLDAPKPEQNYVFGFYYPTDTSMQHEAESLNIGINPYTGEVVNRRVFYHAWNPLRHSLMGFFFKLHYAFLLGETGATLVGALAVLLLISALTGLILWWPLTGNWKRALTIKRRASAERFNHDLHQSAGFYSLIVMLALLISGIYFNLPDQFRWLVEQFSVLTPEPNSTDNSSANNQYSPPIETGLTKAKAIYPGSKLQFLSVAAQDSAALNLCFRDIPALRPKVLDMGCVTVDIKTGAILGVKDSAHGSAGDVFMQWQWPLHSGQALGWTGRILVFITGLLCPLMFITGVISWFQKRKAKAVKLARSVNP